MSVQTTAACLVDESAPRLTGRLTVRLANSTDRNEIYRIRHDVYAREIGQHATNSTGRLRNALDEYNDYIVATDGDSIVGFVSITSPGRGKFSLEKYLPRGEWPFPADERLFEVRLLTVVEQSRRTWAAGLLMYSALRWVAAQGGTRIVAIGRREVVELYARVGMQRQGRHFQSGQVHYELLGVEVADAERHLEKSFNRHLQTFRRTVIWELDAPFFVEPAARCYHGGASFGAIGTNFTTLERRHDIINADVLDAWFPPAPGVLDALREHLDWVLRTSPPTNCDGLIAATAQARDVPARHLVPGGGSSDLIFRAFTRWLSPCSRVLLLDPTYGEYAHVLQNVIRCRVDRLLLDERSSYCVDLDQLGDRVESTRPELVVLVNPNNPTGQHIPRRELEDFLRRAPATTRFWIDEAYLDYIDPSESLEQFAADSDNVIVCKSMSKVYALSGVRAAYLCAPCQIADDLRRFTPPWSVSLPGQIAGVHALADPDYYRRRYHETHIFRNQLSRDLESLGFSVLPGCANFLLCRLGEHHPDARTLLDRCRTRELFLRDISSMTCRPASRTFRVAVKDAETNARIVEIIRETLIERRTISR
jgi:histidinol-phosphate/aromatic aminotransferase/cobyric acid decarboxylase-like protein/GNAT superfamily N-acetyltransferase